MFKKYLFNQLIAIDQLANALLGGDPDETISSRIGKRIRANPNDRSLYYILSKLLDKLDKNHCAEAIEEDEGGDALVK